MVTADEVTEAVIDMLARAEGRPADQVLAELVAAGPDLAIDSLRIVEILTTVERRYGVRLPADPVTARSTRSVRSFARQVIGVISEGVQGDQ